MKVDRAENHLLQRVVLGAEAGAVAGLVLLLAECAASAILGGSILAPPRLAASVALGAGVLSPLFPFPGPVLLGSMVFPILGAVYGVVAALVLLRNHRPHRSITVLAACAFYAAVIWIVNGLTVGPFLFAQISVLNLLWQGFVAHVIFFGLVLGTRLVRPNRR